LKGPDGASIKVEGLLRDYQGARTVTLGTSNDTLSSIDVDDMLETAYRTLRLEKTGNMRVPFVIRIVIRLPRVQPLKIVDLPGFVRDGTEQIPQLAHELILGYIQNPRSVVLAVFNGCYDVANQVVLEQVMRVDPHGKRSMCIMTKPDRLKQLGNLKRMWIRTVQDNGTQFQCPQRWHVLLNRNSFGRVSDINALKKRDEIEEDYINTWYNPWHILYKTDQWGVVHLRNHVAKLVLNASVDANFQEEVHPGDPNQNLKYGEVKSKVDSINSDVSSVFSDNLSISSASSTDAPGTDRTFAFEIARALLENEDLSRLLMSLIEAASANGHSQRVERSLLKAIREFAKELQNTAHGQLEALVANLASGQCLLITRALEALSGLPDRETTTSFHLQELDTLVEVRMTSSAKMPYYLQSLHGSGEGDNEASEGQAHTGQDRDQERSSIESAPAEEPSESEEGIDDDERSERPESRQIKLPHITKAKNFLLEDRPFLTLLASIQELLENLKIRRETKTAQG
jgi:hypothetical protein